MSFTLTNQMPSSGAIESASSTSSKTTTVAANPPVAAKEQTSETSKPANTEKPQTTAQATKPSGSDSVAITSYNLSDIESIETTIEDLFNKYPSKKPNLGALGKSIDKLIERGINGLDELEKLLQTLQNKDIVNNKPELKNAILGRIANKVGKLSGDLSKFDPGNEIFKFTVSTALLAVGSVPKDLMNRYEGQIAARIGNLKILSLSDFAKNATRKDGFWNIAWDASNFAVTAAGGGITGLMLAGAAAGSIAPGPGTIIGAGIGLGLGIWSGLRTLNQKGRFIKPEQITEELAALAENYTGMLDENKDKDLMAFINDQSYSGSTENQVAETITVLPPSDDTTPSNGSGSSDIDWLNINGMLAP